jgi:hypothetical protein
MKPTWEGGFAYHFLHFVPDVVQVSLHKLHARLGRVRLGSDGAPEGPEIRRWTRFVRTPVPQLAHPLHESGEVVITENMGHRTGGDSLPLKQLRPPSPFLCSLPGTLPLGLFFFQLPFLVL